MGRPFARMPWIALISFHRNHSVARVAPASTILIMPVPAVASQPSNPIEHTNTTNATVAQLVPMARTSAIRSAAAGGNVSNPATSMVSRTSTYREIRNSNEALSRPTKASCAAPLRRP